jgi:hypothetical protein
LAVPPKKLFDFVHVTNDEVIDFIKVLDLRSSAGISGIPVVILNEHYDIIANPLVNLYKSFIDQQIFIAEWKTAIVTPLYKNKGDVSDLNN